MATIRNYTVKTVLLGSVSVGKTSLCHYLVHKEALTNSTPTVGGAHFQFDLPIAPNDKYQFTVMLWDTAGSERYASMLGVYLRSAQVALVVCDVKDDDSIHEVQRSLEHLKNMSPHTPSYDDELECKPIFILNKCDLATDQLIDKQEQLLRKVIKGCISISDSEIIIVKTCGLNGVGVYTAPGGHPEDQSSIISSAIAPAMSHVLSKLADRNELIVQRQTISAKQGSVNLNERGSSSSPGGSTRSGGGCC